MSNQKEQNKDLAEISESLGDLAGKVEAMGQEFQEQQLVAEAAAAAQGVIEKFNQALADKFVFVPRLHKLEKETKDAPKIGRAHV